MNVLSYKTNVEYESMVDALLYLKVIQGGIEQHCVNDLKTTEEYWGQIFGITIWLKKACL